MKAKLLIHALCCLVLQALDTERKINTLNLLLPLSSEARAEYTLEAFNGCYHFSSSDSAIISITALDANGHESTGCSTKARVRVETDAMTRSIVWLVASEEVSGVILRCEARVAPIHRLQIVTRLRTVDVGNFETVEAVGYDRQGNTFSSLEGLKFQWKIKQEGSLAEFVTFRTSGFQVGSKRQQIEDMNSQSDQIVLRGLKTGKIQLSAAYSDSKFDSLQTSVELFIIEHILIRPENSVTLLQCSQTQIQFFRLLGEKGKRHAEKIVHPENRFKALKNPENLIDITTTFKVVSKNAIGTTLVTFTDQTNPESNLALAVNVADPENFDFSIKNISDDNIADWVARLTYDPKSNFFEQPYEFSFTDNWNAAQGGVYIIKPSLKGRDNSEFYLEEETIKWTFDPIYIKVLRNENHFVIIKAEIPGNSIISASIEPKRCRTKPLVASKELPIYSRIQIQVPRNQNQEAYLPGLTWTSTPQLLDLEAFGGSGSYVWEIENVTVAKLVRGNQLVVTGNGRTRVRCRDALNKFNSDSFIVVVEDIGKLQAFEKRKEGEKDTDVFIFFKAVGISGYPFANCTLANVAATVEQLTSSLTGDVPASFGIKLQNWDTKSRNEFLDSYGKSQVFDFQLVMFSNHWLQSKTDEANILKSKDHQKQPEINLLSGKYSSLSGVAVFRTSSPGAYLAELKHPSLPTEQVQIRVYQPFTYQFPTDYDASMFGDMPMLAYGNSIKIHIRGGPEMWEFGLEPSLAHTQNDSGHFSQVSINKGSDGVDLVFTCKTESAIGKTHMGTLEEKDYKKTVFVYVSISNEASHGLLYPAVAKTSFSIVCGRPAVAKLFQVNTKNQKGYKFLQTHKDKLLLRNEKSHYFVYWNFDSTNKPYYNFTGVTNKVSVSQDQPSAYASFKKKTIPTENIPEKEENGNGELLNPRIIKTVSAHGTEFWVLTLNARTGKVQIHVKLEEKTNTFTDTITINSMKILALEPKATQLLFIPENEGELSILNGSGNFRVWSENPEVLQAIHQPSSKIIKLRPQGKGRAKVWVEDLGLESPMRTYADVEIVGYESLFIELSKRQVQKGESIQAVISGSTLIKAQLAHLDVRLTSSPKSGLTIMKKDSNVFTITADEEGDYSIIAQSDNKILGKSASLTVYLPLKIFPEAIMTMPDCETFFKLIGGPSDLYSGDYSITISDAEYIGSLIPVHQGTYKFTADKGIKVGRITVTAQSHNSHADHNVIAKASAVVNVVYPDSLIVSGNYQLLKGASSFLQIHPAFNGTLFSPSFCDLKYRVSLTNTSEDPKNQAINVIPISSGQEKSESHFLAKIIAQKPGNEVIHIQLIYTGSKISQSGVFPLESTFIITVYPNLEVPTVSFLDASPSCNRIFGQGMILMPPNTDLDLKNKVQLSILHQDKVVTIRDSTKISSANVLGFDTLTITDNETRSRAAYAVKVENPSHLVFEDIQKVAFIHPGSTVKVLVRFMDAWGRLFAHPLNHINLNLIISHPAVIEVTFNSIEGILSINGKGNGKAILMVQSSDYPKLSFTMSVVVGTLLMPRGDIVVHVGADVQMKSIQETYNIPPQLTKDEQNMSRVTSQYDKWMTSNAAVVDVNPDTGLCNGKRSGNATITYKSSISPKAEVRVVEIISLTPSPLNPQLISNTKDFWAASSRFLFKFTPNFNVVGAKLTNDTLINQQLDYNCTVNARGFKVSKVSKSLEEFECEIAFSSSYSEDYPQQIVLTLNIWSKKSSFHIEESVTVNVAIAFTTNMSGNKIQLSVEDPRKTFVIKTPVMLTITSDPQLDDHVRTEFFSKNSSQVVSIDFTGKEKFGVSGKMVIKNPASDQKETLIITYEPTTSFWSRISFAIKGDNRLFGSDWLIIIVCLVMIGMICNEILSKGDKKNDGEINTISRMSSSRSVYNATPRHPF